MHASNKGLTRRHGLRAMAWAAATLAIGKQAWATTDTWPGRPLKMLIGFSAGGAVDNVGRQLAQGLGARLGQSVIVENKPGATGILAGDATAKSLADGYTLLLGTQSTMLVAPAVYPKMPFRPMDDLAPISLVASVPLVLVVHPSVSVHNVKDLIALARAQKGELAYASSGQGGPQHVASELLNQMAGVKMVHIPYKGESNALADILGGQVTVMFGNLPTLLPSIRAGKLRAIAVSSLQRSDVAPDIPTVAESGLPGFEALTWFGLFAPAATPRPVIDRLHREVVSSLADKEFSAKLRSQGLTLVGNDPAKFRSYMQTETVKWAKLVESAKIKPD